MKMNALEIMNDNTFRSPIAQAICVASAIEVNVEAGIRDLILEGDYMELAMIGQEIADYAGITSKPMSKYRQRLQRSSEVLAKEYDLPVPEGTKVTVQKAKEANIPGSLAHYGDVVICASNPQAKAEVESDSESDSEAVSNNEMPEDVKLLLKLYVALDDDGKADLRDYAAKAVAKQQALERKAEQAVA